MKEYGAKKLKGVKHRSLYVDEKESSIFQLDNKY